MQGFLIDGYPADVEQAGDFESDISAPSAIIFLEAAPEVLTERLIGRGNFDDNKESTGPCKKIPACLNFPALLLPSVLGSQCRAHQP